jgi:hypothetical protein
VSSGIFRFGSLEPDEMSAIDPGGVDEEDGVVKVIGDGMVSTSG